MSFCSKITGRWNAEGGYREFLAIAFPLILSTSSLAVQELVDRIFLAWYSPESVAAALPAGMLHLAITGLFIGTASYTGTFVAQYYGAGMRHRIGPVVWQGIYFSIIGGVVPFSFIPFAPEIFLMAGHEPLVQKYETVFFQVLCFGSFPMIASSAMSGFFSGLGRTLPVMFINIFSTTVTIVLDYCLIFGNFGFPELGIKGAGIATVCSGVCAVICYMIMILRPSRAAEYATRNMKFDFDLFLRLVKYGIPAGMQFFIDLCGFTVFILLVGQLGTASLAATNMAFNINTIAFLPMIGSGVAVSVLVGQYIGAEKPEMAEKSTYSSYHITFAYMSVFSILFIAWPELFVNLYISEGNIDQGMINIVMVTSMLLRFVAIYSLFDSANIIFSCAIRGAGDTFFVMMASVFSIILMTIPTYIAIHYFKAGLFACWIIVTIYTILLSFIYFGRFRSGVWKKMRVIEVNLAAMEAVSAADGSGNFK